MARRLAILVMFFKIARKKFTRTYKCSLSFSCPGSAVKYLWEINVAGKMADGIKQAEDLRFSMTEIDRGNNLCEFTSKMNATRTRIQLRVEPAD